MTARTDRPIEPEGLVTELEPGECWELLTRTRFGRIALPCGDDDIDIYPIDFAVDGRDLVFRTAEGTKLLEVVLFGRITLEADERDAERGIAWSVVVKGRPEVLELTGEIEAAERLGIEPWTRTPKNRFVRITETRVSGRRLYAPLGD